jgi:hypothetical protein
MTQLDSLAPARPRWRSVLATLALVGALFAAGSVAPASADVGTGPGVISGTVTDANGLPLAGVFVGAIISSETSSFFGQAYTDATGSYQFTDLAVGVTYQLTTSVSGHPFTPAQYVTLTEESATATANFVIASYPAGVGTISGLVTAEGVPLGDLLVSAWNDTTGQTLSTYSDASGHYEFTGLGNGLWNISGYAGTEYVSITVSSVQLTDSSHDATVDLPFVLWPVGTASIHGVASDSATGEALVGVTIYSWSPDAPHSSSATTDETGAYSFDQLPAGAYEVSFGDGGYLPVVKNIQLSDGQSVTANFALVALNGTISGHVTGPDGNPVADLWVSASSDLSGSGAITDQNGDYVITDIGPVAYTVTVGGVQTAFDGQDRVVTGVANGDVRANFTLANRSTGFIAGSILGPNGGYYLKPVCATLYSSKSKKPVREVLIDGEHYGEDAFAFDNLKPGSYTIEAKDCDDDPSTKFNTVYLGGAKSYKDASFITVTVGSESFGNTLQLTLRGK